MEKIRKSLMMKKLYHIHNEELDPYKDCEKCDGYGTIIILPNKCILNVFFCCINRYIKVYHCSQCKGTGKIKK